MRILLVEDDTAIVPSEREAERNLASRSLCWLFRVVEYVTLATFTI